MFFPALGNDLVVMELDSQFRAFLLKTTVWLQDRGSVFHPSQVDQMNAGISGNLVAKSKLLFEVAL